MSKTGGRVKALREKARHQARGNSHGGFKRFSSQSVETREAACRYYSGDNTDERFRPVQERSAFHKMARQGEWKYVIEAAVDKSDRRDGGMKRLNTEHHAVSVDTGDAQIRRVATRKVVTREHLRDSLGTGSLFATCVVTRSNGKWELYSDRHGTRKG